MSRMRYLAMMSRCFLIKASLALISSVTGIAILLSVVLLAHALVKAVVEEWSGETEGEVQQTTSCLSSLAVWAAHLVSVGIGERANAEVVAGEGAS
jgi:hypothetical protein